MQPDILILGAGVAGLSAALDLARAGLQVEIVEGRDCVGGRIHTCFDPTLNHAVELGAEFVHGVPIEIWQPLQEHDCRLHEVEGDFWCSTAGRLQPCRFFREVEKILAKMSDDSPDQSFLDFLSHHFPGPGQEETMRHAVGYVSGFNAADPAQVSVHWLVHSQAAEERVKGDRSFRIAGGYKEFLDILNNELQELHVPVRLGAQISRVRWSPGLVEVAARSAGGDDTFTAPRGLITFPLGVLQASVGGHADEAAIAFEPELPPEKVSALGKIAMGKVVRVVLCFRERVWQEIAADGKTLANMSFLFSDDELFPTWWTQMPAPVPIITGWSPARSAESLAGMSEARITMKAMESLASLLGLSALELQSQLVASYFQDWDADPFSRGAYSYVKVGGEGCQKTLGAPLLNTLFFAGEATDTSGQNGTVQGAIASGKRAAQEIIAAR